MASISLVAGYITDNFTGYSAYARDIARIAVKTVEAAGVAGGSDEVEAIARDGWPKNQQIDYSAALNTEDEDALRGAVQYAAQLEIEERVTEVHS